MDAICGGTRQVLRWADDGWAVVSFSISSFCRRRSGVQLDIAAVGMPSSKRYFVKGGGV